MSHREQIGMNRRDFLRVGTAGLASVAMLPVAPGSAGERAGSQPGGRSIVIASANGFRKSSVNGKTAVETAWNELRANADVLDAVVAGVSLVEDDPEDTSVGLGGLPNEDGVVELDASVMYGPTHKAGAVASLRNIRNPSQVARLVMLRTDHVLIVGEGALRFARAHGFKEEDLLTEKTRETWLRWKETLSEDDDWLPPADAPTREQARRELPWTYGTINCLAVNAKGDIAGVTTTSGLGFKIPGRVGDSPIIGAGLYVDNDVGAAGSTGRGEANLQNCSSAMIVEHMRNHPNESPADACLAVLERIAKKAEPRLRDKEGRAAFDLKFYALRKDGTYGSAVMWSSGDEEKKAKFAACDAKGGRLEEAKFLYQKE